MRLLVGTVAIVGALAAGGIPAMALTSGTHHATPARSASTSTSTQTSDAGPPSWAPAWGYRDKGTHDRGHRDQADRGEKAERDKTERDKTERGGAERGAEHSRKMAALAHAHSKGMRAWASCRQAHAHSRTPGDPQATSRTCGERPEPPGHLK